MASSIRRPYAPRVPLEERRTQLLDAALAIIVRDGYDGVSVDAIAREVGVTRPVVYGAYDGLGPLLLALLDRQQQIAFGRLLDALPRFEPDQDPVDVAVASALQLAAMLRADPDLWRPILLSPAGVPETVALRVDADRERIRSLIAAWLDHASGGRIDADLFSHAVIAILEHFGRLLLHDAESFDDARLAAAVRSAATMVLA